MFGWQMVPALWELQPTLLVQLPSALQVPCLQVCPDGHGFDALQVVTQVKLVALQVAGDMQSASVSQPTAHC
jgi:hypothetical protein